MPCFCPFTVYSCPGSGFVSVSLHMDPDPTFIIRIQIHGCKSASLAAIRNYCPTSRGIISPYPRLVGGWRVLEADRWVSDLGDFLRSVWPVKLRRKLLIDFTWLSAFSASWAIRKKSSIISWGCADSWLVERDRAVKIRENVNVNLEAKLLIRFQSDPDLFSRRPRLPSPRFTGNWFKWTGTNHIYTQLFTFLAKKYKNIKKIYFKRWYRYVGHAWLPMRYPGTHNLWKKLEYGSRIQHTIKKYDFPTKTHIFCLPTVSIENIGSALVLYT